MKGKKENVKQMLKKHLPPADECVATALSSICNDDKISADECNCYWGDLEEGCYICPLDGTLADFGEKMYDLLLDHILSGLPKKFFE